MRPSLERVEIAPRHAKNLRDHRHGQRMGELPDDVGPAARSKTLERLKASLKKTGASRQARAKSG